MLPRFAWAAALAVVAVLCLACGRARTPQPDGPSPVAVKGTLANAFVKSGASQTLAARIMVTSAPRSSSARPAVNLVLLVDTSGSMEGKAITDARAASLALL